MLSTKRCQKLVRSSRPLKDNELQEILSQLYPIAEIALDLFGSPDPPEPQPPDPPASPAVMKALSKRSPAKKAHRSKGRQARIKKQRAIYCGKFI